MSEQSSRSASTRCCSQRPTWASSETTRMRSARTGGDQRPSFAVKRMRSRARCSTDAAIAYHRLVAVATHRRHVRQSRRCATGSEDMTTTSLTAPSRVTVNSISTQPETSCSSARGGYSGAAERTSFSEVAGTTVGRGVGADRSCRDRGCRSGGCRRRRSGCHPGGLGGARGLGRGAGRQLLFGELVEAPAHHVQAGRRAVQRRRAVDQAFG